MVNQSGAWGEARAIADSSNWVRRPSGSGLKVLLEALRKTGISIKGSSFDAIELPEAERLDFRDPVAVEAALPWMTFIEIKTASQARVKEDFSGFFFSFTEAEIAAAEALGTRHRVALYNKSNGRYQMTSIPEVLARAKSTTWQLCVQL